MNKIIMDAEYDLKIEKLLLLIEGNPVLYDKSNPDYKNDKKKCDIWRTIAGEVGLDYSVAKTKFESIRDSYKKWKDSVVTKSGQAAKPRKKYKWVDHLGFLQVHLAHRESGSNMSTEVKVEPSTGYEAFEETTEILDEKETAEPKKKGEKRKLNTDVNNELIDYLREKKANVGEKNSDPLGLFFKASLETVRGFPKLKQLEVKRKLTTILFEIEEQLASEE